MMSDPKSLVSNSGLLYSTDRKIKTNEAYDLVSTITVERPLQCSGEARIAARSLNNILSFLESSLTLRDSVPSAVETERMFNGLSEIVNACRLVSLRVEQYLDIQEEEQR